MNPSFISDIDKQIVQLEKQLSALYSKRVSLLEAEIQRSKSRSEVLGGAPEAPVAKAPAAAPVKRKVSRKQAAKAKASAPAAEQPKGTQAPAKQEVTEAPAEAPKKAARKAKAAKKRTRTPSAVVETKILEALKEAGLFGISQIELSKKTGLGYQTVVKKLKELPSVEKKGAGKDGRFMLKA